jgi:hypothetical protein
MDILGGAMAGKKGQKRRFWSDDEKRLDHRSQGRRSPRHLQRGRRTRLLRHIVGSCFRRARRFILSRDTRALYQNRRCIPAADYADDPRAQKIAAAARLNELRENWLNPPDLVERVPEVVPGYPDRILPTNEAAEKELKKRTLTNLYNTRPAWLDHAHKALDEAVAEAYGWGDDWRNGALTDDEILARLFRLNQERAAQASS